MYRNQHSNKIVSAGLTLERSLVCWPCGYQFQHESTKFVLQKLFGVKSKVIIFDFLVLWLCFHAVWSQVPQLKKGQHNIKQSQAKVSPVASFLKLCKIHNEHKRFSWHKDTDLPRRGFCLHKTIWPIDWIIGWINLIEWFLFWHTAKSGV